MDNYYTIKKSASDSFIEKKSKFIGYCKPVTSETEAIAFINEIKSKHWNATHNVYAYILRDGNVRRYSDDGEPQGTAGIPVLDVLCKNELTDTVVVVTRYFGGVLLGGGGLVRAYSHSAAIAVHAGEIIEMRCCSVLQVTCSYTLYGKISSLIPELGAVCDSTDFGENVTLILHIPTTDLNLFEKKLADISNGSVSANLLKTDFFAY